MKNKCLVWIEADEIIADRYQIVSEVEGFSPTTCFLDGDLVGLDMETCESLIGEVMEDIKKNNQDLEVARGEDTL